MKVDGGFRYDPRDPASAARSAQVAAAVGYHRLYASETAHDPFLPVARAAGVADIDLGTNIAVAFARNPMTTAMTAHDLHALTGGRFVLGLGSQVRAHITRRFAMPWSPPAARMREFVGALRAIWGAWERGEPPEFDGQIYRHTLSAPTFEPAPHGHLAPRVFLAAVGQRMTEVAGEVGDGLLCHGFTSASYLADVTLPALRRGLAAGGRPDGAVEVGLSLFVATAAPGADLTPEVERVRRNIAFYGSTPAYRGVLDHHGWGDLHAELHRLSRAQRWGAMTSLVDDEALTTLAVVAGADTLAAAIRARFDGLVDRVQLTVPYLDDPDTWAPVIAALSAG